MGRHREHPEAAAVRGDHLDNGRVVEMQTWTQGDISGLADGMNKGVGKREIQGSFWFKKLEHLPELRSGTQLRIEVLGLKTSWVTSESSSVKGNNHVHPEA